MKLYFAGGEYQTQQLHDSGVKQLLITMAYGEKKIPGIPKVFGENYDLIIDSGAFSYAKKGGIKLEDWIAKAGALMKAVPKAKLIGLDVIGDPKTTMSNYLKISEHFPCIPTWHVGSPLEYLDEYIDREDLVAIGGMVPYKMEPEKLCRHLDKVFSRFSHTEMPKFHAFGYFSQEILDSYPFYSADASTWVNYSKFGEHHRFRKMQYTRMRPVTIAEIDPRGLSLDDLYIYCTGHKPYRFTAVIEAVLDYEKYLTHLWQSRQLQFNWKRKR